MDALNKLNVLGLVLAAVLVAMACVKTDRVRSWRANINPSAPELPDSAFVAARVLFLSLAGFGVYLAVQGFGVSDDGSWSDGELTSAVEQTADDLNGYTFQADDAGTPLAFPDYASLIEEKVLQYGGGDAPGYGVSVDPAESNTPAKASFTITADGTDTAFCTHLTRTRSKKDDYTPPGITGGEGTLTYQGYRLTTSLEEGEC
ncbi:hypothetical protein [Streptomyces rubradiris]|uniref:Uncharacterized protein n=1 Tax=Streptomyces rubradiris TaxID=285531 RepID=A0ABQ3RGI4_STRRR|nr:hypothetical protein [Streptomyces rubradiris]GHH22021.1 hypothetical protein GCM10018792_57220 [Streptomyces rubradiris]GHI54973.1 hypothetical protein Srubr_48190 [Streptomyces rubradiris]